MMGQWSSEGDSPQQRVTVTVWRWNGQTLCRPCCWAKSAMCVEFYFEHTAPITSYMRCGLDSIASQTGEMRKSIVTCSELEYQLCLSACHHSWHDLRCISMLCSSDAISGRSWPRSEDLTTGGGAAHITILASQHANSNYMKQSMIANCVTP